MIYLIDILLRKPVWKHSLEYFGRPNFYLNYKHHIESFRKQPFNSNRIILSTSFSLFPLYPLLLFQRISFILLAKFVKFFLKNTNNITFSCAKVKIDVTKIVLLLYAVNFPIYCKNF